MINVSNWDEISQHYEDYWNIRNNTPVIALAAPAENPKEIILPEASLEVRRFDPKYIAMESRAWFENTHYALDGYPYISPSIGNDLLSGLLGWDVIYNEASAWVVHSDKPLEEIGNFKLDTENKYYKIMANMLTGLAEDCKNGDYILGMVDLNTLLDGVASLIGSQNLCYELYDDPDSVKRVTMEHFEFYKQVYTVFNKMVTKYQGGDTNWLGAYSKIPWYFISLDFMVMVSGEFFDEFIADPLSKMIDFHERTLFHLDGENAVVHLDRVLEQKKLTGVQVQATPYMQSAEFWIPHLKKIQKAGKNFCVEARHKQDVEDFIKNLDPEGMYLRVWAQSKAEADEIEKMVNNYYGIKRG